MAVINAAVLIAAIVKMRDFENSKADLGTLNGTYWGKQNCKMTGGSDKVQIIEIAVSTIGVCIYVILPAPSSNLQHFCI